MQRTMREIMERAVGEMREALAQEVDEGKLGIGTRTLGRKTSSSSPGKWAGG